MQLTPSPYLFHIVKHYLILENKHDAPSKYRLFSDGNPGIVFYFNTPLMQYTDQHLYAHPSSFVYGQLTQYKDLVSVGKLGMLVVVLQPYAIYALSRVAAYELNDDIANLSDVFGAVATDLEDQVLGAASTQDRINHIESFLLKKLSIVSYTEGIFSNALKLINDYKGNISVAGLLNILPVTERQLERKFKQFIGVGPKRFADTVKLQHFLKLLQKQSPCNNIADTVYEGGYYDQAHLNNYFRKNTGITPSQYKANSNPLAINFISVPAVL
ncbi:helix-turn-helix domain-containing protein [Mucilaginibacter sabulilitoris]|uniref:Helix-turn-helix domain-containing protein n=1 Tax=Mucilaginibacter sabulilitoris TaxID=1173583 RepID=A0ABZ0TUP0_9SPHI|nr:helix-turn-helix domain-containing protein [Mucilaginibacter sabulilitoris]WPU96654.1 helix-turn-helix domain-containing protein [Mucilaginibacter sabulilitoris]